MSNIDILAQNLLESLRAATANPVEASGVLITVLAHLVYFGRVDGASVDTTIDATVQVLRTTVGNIEAEMERRGNV